MGCSVLVFSCILSTLVATGFSLSCLECEGEDEKSCKGNFTTCLSDSDSCIAVSTFTKDGAQDVKKYIRSCTDPKLCFQKGSFTSKDITIKISTTCCSTSECNPPMPVLPERKTRKNEVSCLECRGREDETCTPRGDIDCTGDEKRCVSLYATAEPLSNTFARGCGTEGLCQLKKYGFKTSALGMEFICPGGFLSGRGSLQVKRYLKQVLSGKN